VTRVLSTVFGLLMVAAAAVGSPGPPVVAGGIAVIAVGVGIVFRPAATAAVLLSVALIVVSNPSHVLAALSDFARAYLVCRHAVGEPAGVVVGAGRQLLPPLVLLSSGWLRRLSRCSCRGCRWRRRWRCWQSTHWPRAHSSADCPPSLIAGGKISRAGQHVSGFENAQGFSTSGLANSGSIQVGFGNAGSLNAGFFNSGSDNSGIANSAPNPGPCTVQASTTRATSPRALQSGRLFRGHPRRALRPALKHQRSSCAALSASSSSGCGKIPNPL